MKIAASHSLVKAADIPMEDLAANKKVSDREKVAEVARQFEAVLLRQMLQQTRKSVATSSSTSGDSTSGIYDDMINNQLADSISRSGGLGLAKSLQTQLTHQTLPSADAPNPAAAAPVTRQDGKRGPNP